MWDKGKSENALLVQCPEAGVAYFNTDITSK